MLLADNVVADGEAEAGGGTIPGTSRFDRKEYIGPMRGENHEKISLRFGVHGRLDNSRSR
jgi:hypothetical protein